MSDRKFDYYIKLDMNDELGNYFKMLGKYKSLEETYKKGKFEVIDYINNHYSPRVGYVTVISLPQGQNYFHTPNKEINEKMYDLSDFLRIMK